MNSMVALRTVSGIKFIDTNDIIYCKADGRYTRVHFSDGKSVITARLLKSFEDKLPSDIFLRIHKSHIINIRYITNYKKGIIDSIVLGNLAELEISKRKKKAVMENLGRNFVFI